MGALPSIFFLFFISISAWAAETPLTQDSSSTSRGSPNTNLASESYWQSKVQAEPNNPNYSFNLGIAYEQNRNLSKAAECFRHVIGMNTSLTPLAQFNLGLALFYLGQRPQARQALDKISLNTAPPQLKQKILELRKQLDAPDTHFLLGTKKSIQIPREKIFSAFLDLSYGQNSNPQTLSGISAASVAPDQQTQGRAVLDLQIESSAHQELRADYSFSGTYFSNQVASNYILHTSSLAFAIFQGRYRFRVVPEFALDYYGGAPFSQAPGLTLEIARGFGSNLLGASIFGQLITNISQMYSYLSGTQQKGQIFFRAEGTRSRFFTSLYVGRFMYQDSATLAQTYSFYGSALTYAISYPDLSVTLTGTVEKHVYNMALADSYARADLRSYVDIQVDHFFNSQFHGYLDFNHSENTSNFFSSPYNFNYSQTVYGLGVGWIL